MSRSREEVKRAWDGASALKQIGERRLPEGSAITNARGFKTDSVHNAPGMVSLNAHEVKGRYATSEGLEGGVEVSEAFKEKVEESYSGYDVKESFRVSDPYASYEIQEPYIANLRIPQLDKGKVAPGEVGTSRDIGTTGKRQGWIEEGPPRVRSREEERSRN